MKIALVHNTYQQTGGEDRVFEQEHRMLEAEGHRVIGFTRSNSAAAAYSGVRRLNLAAATVWSSRARGEFRNLLAREKPDVVHVHNTFMMISPSITEGAIPVATDAVDLLGMQGGGDSGGADAAQFPLSLSGGQFLPERKSL